MYYHDTNMYVHVSDNGMNANHWKQLLVNQCLSRKLVLVFRRLNAFAVGGVSYTLISHWSLWESIHG
jgi:hypothetical protein